MRLIWIGWVVGFTALAAADARLKNRYEFLTNGCYCEISTAQLKPVIPCPSGFAKSTKGMISIEVCRDPHAPMSGREVLDFTVAHRMPSFIDEKVCGSYHRNRLNRDRLPFDRKTRNTLADMFQNAKTLIADRDGDVEPVDRNEIIGYFSEKGSVVSEDPPHGTELRDKFPHRLPPRIPGYVVFHRFEWSDADLRGKPEPVKLSQAYPVHCVWSTRAQLEEDMLRHEKAIMEESLRRLENKSPASPNPRTHSPTK